MKLLSRMYNNKKLIKQINLLIYGKSFESWDERLIAWIDESVFHKSPEVYLHRDTLCLSFIVIITIYSVIQFCLSNDFLSFVVKIFTISRENERDLNVTTSGNNSNDNNQSIEDESITNSLTTLKKVFENGRESRIFKDSKNNYKENYLMKSEGNKLREKLLQIEEDETIKVSNELLMIEHFEAYNHIKKIISSIVDKTLSYIDDDNNNKKTGLTLKSKIPVRSNNLSPRDKKTKILCDQ